MDQNAHPSRKVAVADHIWDAFEQMAQEMGSNRDALINQAMFMFARLNGFLEAGRAEAVPAARVAEVGGRTAPVAPPAPPAQPPPRAPAAASAAVVPPMRNSTQPPRAPTEDDSQRRGVAERVLETAAELERLIQKKNQPQPPPEEEEELVEDEPLEDEPLDDEPVDDLEGMADDLVGEDPAGDDELPPDDGGLSLYMTTDAGSTERITKERFVIGRGKHCDFVINSGKVSREHAQIIRDNGEYYIEDLGSSNGTWFQKQRIKRRKIEDGDEYLICNEKVKLAVR